MVNMEKTVKSVMAEQGEIQKWKLEVEAKVLEITDTQEYPGPEGGLVHRQKNMVAHRQVICQRVKVCRLPPGVEATRTPPPVGGTIPNLNQSASPFDFGWSGKYSGGGWSQWSGSGVPSMNFHVFEGSNPKLWKHRCETYFEFYFYIEHFDRLMH